MPENENLLSALAAAQATIDNPPMSGKGPYGAFSTLTDYANAIRKPFAAQGLTYRWDVDTDDERVLVTCIIAHSTGEEIRGGTMTAGRGTTIQHAMGATTYLKRGTLAAMTGLTGEIDDDGQTHATEVKTEPRKSGSRAVRVEARASDKQIGFLSKLMREAGIDEVTLNDFAKDTFGWELPTQGLAHLSATHASDLIDAMTKKKSPGRDYTPEGTRDGSPPLPQDDPWATLPVTGPDGEVLA